MKTSRIAGVVIAISLIAASAHAEDKHHRHGWNNGWHAGHYWSGGRYWNGAAWVWPFAAGIATLGAFATVPSWGYPYGYYQPRWCPGLYGWQAC